MNVFAIPAIASAAYHAIALFAGMRKRRARSSEVVFTPPVSILKPVRGADERFAEAIASHAVQDYPEYEILFGLSDPDDPARRAIERLARDHPEISIRLIAVSTDAPNAKVGVLEALAAEARHGVLLVNDSDILVQPDYLRETVKPLSDPKTGLVTCLYRGAGGSFPARSEALGIATEFAPSVLVARETGVKEFAMGSTLAFRASDLARIGGFRAIRDFLADDYQLGKRLTGLGLNVFLGKPVVETSLGSGSWSDVWKHQIRWSRTIRVSRPGGYLGYIITHSVIWCALAALTGSAAAAVACYAVRIVSAVVIAGSVLDDRASLRLFWWLPVRDAFGVAVWVAGWSGRAVEWRGQRLRLDRSGRISPA